MTPEEIRAVVLRCIRRIAPEVEQDEIVSNVALRGQLDIDSMDFLNIMIEIHKELGVEIREEDYPRLATLDGCVAYIDEALQEQRSSEGRAARTPLSDSGSL
jgi:acyl carrier protein